jgi:lipopolysaccharide/colanic/teichoic acid biosynthesis glycosyltransferase
MRFRRASSGVPSPSSSVLRGILSIPEFHAVLRRERNRSERSSLPFSILFCDVGAHDGTAAAAAVALILRQRLRSTDEVGWFDRRRIAAVLPYTDGEEARTVLRHVEHSFSAGGVPVACQIETCPARDPDRDDREHGGREGGAGGGPHQPTETGSTPVPGAAERVQSVPRLLVVPLPAWKRAMDLLGAIAALALLWPVILVAAVAIKLDSKGPVFYRQRRVGAGGRLFDFFKLRTMQVGADELKQGLRPQNEQSGPVFKMKADPRITRVGRFLRRSSLDELPQFWNVLKGDMSLVGPRPPTPDEVVHYEPWQLRRLLITPGLTCLWQVSGRSEVGFDDWVRLDLRYAERRSLLFDLALIARTVPAVLSGRGAF